MQPSLALGGRTAGDLNGPTRYLFTARLNCRSNLVFKCLIHDNHDTPLNLTRQACGKTPILTVNANQILKRLC